jgi:hypothetical protein
MRLSKIFFGGWRRQRIFFKIPILFILLRKMNKIGILKNFILPLQAAE